MEYIPRTAKKNAYYDRPDISFAKKSQFDSSCSLKHRKYHWIHYPHVLSIRQIRFTFPSHGNDGCEFK